MQNPYDVLGVTKETTIEEIKVIYKRLCMTLHPDRGGSEESFKILQESYSILIDPIKRKNYDQYGTSNMSDKVVVAKNTAINLVINLLEKDVENFIEVGTMEIQKSMAIREAQIVELLSKKGKLERKLKKFKKAESNSLLIKTIETKIENYMKGVNTLQENIEVEKLIIEELNNFELEPTVNTNSYNSTTYINPTSTTTTVNINF